MRRTHAQQQKDGTVLNLVPRPCGGRQFQGGVVMLLVALWYGNLLLLQALIYGPLV